MVIAGKSRGQSGVITRVLSKRNAVVLDGLNLVKRHRRADRQGRKGQIIDKPMPLHVSNVMIVDPKDGKPTRITIKRGKEGERERVAVNSKTTLS